ncbi:hypothetical protein CDAR_651 [Caerostris darwini]|uniref:Uncharacterized protein n=1 Tax=Caerostris darwini TaxID=1538125 RepID=A0AAV4UCB6_9ARAC|nr:hypothetical protein CDAR_651 [Caerostris darwini]
MFERSSPGTGTKSGNPAPRLTGPLASRGPVSGRQDPDAMSFSRLIYYIESALYATTPSRNTSNAERARSACFSPTLPNAVKSERRKKNKAAKWFVIP